MNITDLLGKRCLLKISGGNIYGNPVEEYKILEISPSGTWVKLMNMNGRKYWKPITDIALVEVLIDLKANKPE